MKRRDAVRMLAVAPLAAAFRWTPESVREASARAREALAPGTPYEPVARQWKKEPGAAARTGIACLTCHAPGRLAARRAALKE